MTNPAEPYSVKGDGIAIRTDKLIPTGSGKLDGLRITSKDIGRTAFGLGGQPFSEGNVPILRGLGFKPEKDGTHVEKLRANGASIEHLTAAPTLGLDTTLDSELKVGDRLLVNPYDPDLEVGGSSTGAAYLRGQIDRGEVDPSESDAELTSDYGGSGRQPAAFNGIVGIKTNIREDLQNDGPTLGTVSAFGDLANVARIAEVWDTQTEYSKYLGDPSEMRPLRIGLVKGNLVSRKAGINAQAAVMNEIAYERTKQLLEEAGHEVIDIAPPLELSIAHRLREAAKRWLGLTSPEEPSPYILSRKMVKKVSVAFMRDASILSKDELDEIQDIADDLRGFNKPLGPEDVTPKVFAASVMGASLRRIEAKNNRVFSDARKKTDEWFKAQELDFVLKQGLGDPNAKPTTVLSETDMKLLTMLGETKPSFRRDLLTRALTRFLGFNSMPELAWENTLEMHSVSLPVTLQVNDRGNFIPVSASVSGVKGTEAELFGLTAQLATHGWNTPVDSQGNVIRR